MVPDFRCAVENGSHASIEISDLYGDIDEIKGTKKPKNPIKPISDVDQQLDGCRVEAKLEEPNGSFDMKIVLHEEQ
ncbi:hypothetical protein Tcan_09363 [Toxocara canis]|uniref:Uncharacterized protein n=1 Tax=Toxocara canis TaxID=6265 RepID=A0A0B2V125_TOXCA|nr:hypothetical protein Tcan_09363 [Toxocara canis]